MPMLLDMRQLAFFSTCQLPNPRIKTRGCVQIITSTTTYLSGQTVQLYCTYDHSSELTIQCHILLEIVRNTNKVDHSLFERHSGSRGNDVVDELAQGLWQAPCKTGVTYLFLGTLAVWTDKYLPLSEECNRGREENKACLRNQYGHQKRRHNNHNTNKPHRNKLF